MKIETADFVISLNGRDAGKRFLVIGTDEEYAFLVDGKSRKTGRPKRKKCKHIKFESRREHGLTEKLKNNEKVTNKEIRRVLAEQEYRQEHEKGGM